MSIDRSEFTLLPWPGIAPEYRPGVSMALLGTGACAIYIRGEIVQLAGFSLATSRFAVEVDASGRNVLVREARQSPWNAECLNNARTRRDGSLILQWRKATLPFIMKSEPVSITEVQDFEVEPGLLRIEVPKKLLRW